MTPLKTYAHINSLGGQTDEITVLQQVGDNDYLVDYKGVKCHAIFNPFVCEYYADDLYTVVKEDRQCNRNCKLFADTVTSLMSSQGFYGRLYHAVNELDDDGLYELEVQIAQQNFHDTLDVVLWLEC